MLKRTIAFFPVSTQNNYVATQDTSLDKVKKYIDAQIEYNKFLMERLLRGNKEEIFEIVTSLFLDLTDIPRSIKLPPSKILDEFKQEFIDHIMTDLKEYIRLKECANNNNNNNTNMDYLYLNIQFVYQIWLLGVQSITAKKVELILSHIYDGKDLKKKTKEVLYRITTKSIQSPLMAEILGLSEMLSFIESEVSPYCLKLKDDVQIFQEKGLTYISITNEAMSGKNKKILQFLKQNPTDQAFLSLVDKWIKTNNALKTAKPSSDINDSYLVTFEKMKAKYQLEDEIDRVIEEINARKQASKTAETLEKTKVVSENQSEIGLPPQSRSKVSKRGNRPAKIVRQEENLQSLQTSVEALEETEKPLNSSTNVKEAVTESSRDQLEKDMSPQLSSCSSYVETTNYNSTTEQTADISESSTYEEDEEKLNEDENIEAYSYVQDYSLFAKKNNNARPQQHDEKPKRNVLNLNKEQQETYLKVFDLMPYESINLRALVNLTQALGGTLKTTGANRCRIELKNIYAHILVPKEALTKACNKATVTMHGGGHRSTSSQNNDREEAPNYLISQFKAAFIRAGYTPINLGLDPENTDAPKIET
ncbi:hypothetical protein [Legionella brunensis]|nr:hypothetical protein [Legionella brunensis]